MHPLDVIYRVAKQPNQIAAQEVLNVLPICILGTALMTDNEQYHRRVLRSYVAPIGYANERI